MEVNNKIKSIAIGAERDYFDLGIHGTLWIMKWHKFLRRKGIITIFIALLGAKGLVGPQLYFLLLPEKTNYRKNKLQAGLSLVQS